MCCTCFYAGCVSKMVQIRDVPDQVHSVLKSRAAREGMSLSDFLKRELERSAERPSLLEWLDRTSQVRPITAKQSSVEVIRELRDAAR
jgi:antitoxin FitA